MKKEYLRDLRSNAIEVKTVLKTYMEIILDHLPDGIRHKRLLDHKL